MTYKHAPQKRDESLQPLSRDHYLGLVHAERLRKSANAEDAAVRRQALSEFLDAWRREITAHFDDEERLLCELMSDDECVELHEQHQVLHTLAEQAHEHRAHVEPGAEFCQQLGETLRDHIRWEERTLFPAIQQRATPAQLEALAQHTAPIEQRRGRVTQR